MKWQTQLCGSGLKTSISTVHLANLQPGAFSVSFAIPLPISLSYCHDRIRKRLPRDALQHHRRRQIRDRERAEWMPQRQPFQSRMAISRKKDEQRAALRTSLRGKSIFGFLSNSSGETFSIKHSAEVCLSHCRHAQMLLVSLGLVDENEMK